MVHVSVGEANVGTRQGDPGAKADVETYVKLGDSYGGLFAGNTDAGKGQVAAAESIFASILQFYVPQKVLAESNRMFTGPSLVLSMCI